VEGRLKYGKFTSKDGVVQNTCDIVATEMQLLGGREGPHRQRASWLRSLRRASMTWTTIFRSRADL
jgi:single-stranded DNA-binding protein